MFTVQSLQQKEIVPEWLIKSQLIVISSLAQHKFTISKHLNFLIVTSFSFI